MAVSRAGDSGWAGRWSGVSDRCHRRQVRSSPGAPVSWHSRQQTGEPEPGRCERSESQSHRWLDTCRRATGRCCGRHSDSWRALAFQGPATQDALAPLGPDRAGFRRGCRRSSPHRSGRCTIPRRCHAYRRGPMNSASSVQPDGLCRWHYLRTKRNPSIPIRRCRSYRLHSCQPGWHIPIRLRWEVDSRWPRNCTPMFPRRSRARTLPPANVSLQ